MSRSFDDLKAELLANPAVRTEYEARAAEFDIAAELIAARIKAGLSQAQLASRMAVTQSAVARIESGRHWPSRLSSSATPVPPERCQSSGCHLAHIVAGED